MFVPIEYFRQRRQARIELAEELVEKFTSDEMILFATTTLDWGTGLIPVPEKWRDVVRTSSIPWQFDDIFNGTRYRLNGPTRASPAALLHRHGFVHLFNHLERIAILWEAGAVRIPDLKAMTWVARQIDDWEYARNQKNPYTHGRTKGLFAKTLAVWYPDNAPQRLIDALVSPRRESTRSNDDFDGPE